MQVKRSRLSPTMQKGLLPSQDSLTQQYEGYIAESFKVGNCMSHRINDDPMATSNFFDDRDNRERSSDDSSDDSTTGMRDDQGRGMCRVANCHDVGQGIGRGGRRDQDIRRPSNEESITGNKSQGSGSSKRGYVFELDPDGNVTSLKRFKRGLFKRERIKANEWWLFEASSGELSRYEINEAIAVITTYTDPNQDGIFTRSFRTIDEDLPLSIDWKVPH